MGFGNLGSALDHAASSAEVNMKPDLDSRNFIRLYMARNSFCLLQDGWTGFEYTRPAYIVEVLNAITGWDLRVEDLLIVGERINNLCRCFNTREGLTRRDDYLPPRFTEDPLPDGPSRDQRLTKQQLEEMLDDYYDLRGRDKTTGTQLWLSSGS